MDDFDRIIESVVNPAGGGEAVTADNAANPDSRIWVWDIETGPLPDNVIRKHYTEPEGPPSEFDESTVKTGNLKDATKIKAKIETAKNAWLKQVRDHEQACKDHWEAFKASCALDPYCSRVCTSAYLFADRDDSTYVYQADARYSKESEAALLEDLWTRVEVARQRGGAIIGFGINGFDLPFCLQRSRMLGLWTPRNLFWKNRYPIDLFVDLYDIWKAGRSRKWRETSSDNLHSVLDACGLPSKSGDGSEFWEKYRSPKTRAEAISYAIQDVVVEAALARRLGVIG